MSDDEIKPIQDMHTIDKQTNTDVRLEALEWQAEQVSQRAQELKTDADHLRDKIKRVRELEKDQ